MLKEIYTQYAGIQTLAANKKNYHEDTKIFDS